MKVHEVYKLYQKQLVILISGLSGTGKTQVAASIERDLQLHLINLESFCVKENRRKVKLPNGFEVTDWDDMDTYDWKLFNDDVEKYKEKGVVICGVAFPASKISFVPNFHIHIKLPKDKLIEKRKAYLESHKNTYPDAQKILDGDMIGLILNHVTYPHYIKNREDSKIGKWIDAKDMEPNDIYDETYNYIIKSIENFLSANKESVDKMFERKPKYANIGVDSDDPNFLGIFH